MSKLAVFALAALLSARFVYVCESDCEIVPAGKVRHGRHVEDVVDGKRVLGGWVHLVRLRDYKRVCGAFAQPVK